MIDIEDAYKQYAKYVYKFIFVNVGGNKAITDDLSSEVFLQALKSKHTYKEDLASVKTWLIGISRNVLKKFYGSYRSNVDLATIDDSLTSGNEPEVNQLIILFLNKLTKEERELIVLKYMYDFSILDICKLTKLSESNCKVKLHRSMQKLKRLMNIKP